MRSDKAVNSPQANKEQGRRQEISDSGLILPTRGLKYGFQGTIISKISEK